MISHYIKNGKIFKAPIKIDSADGRVIYTTDPKIIAEAGYTEVKRPEPTIDRMLTQSDRLVNIQTDRDILNNFTFRGQEFYLSMENQTNFSNMFIARDFLTYPQKVKTKTGFMELQTKEDVQEFYLAGVNFIRACLEDGWAEKEKRAAVIKKTYAGNTDSSTEDDAK